MQREGPSYTLDTVRALKERYGPSVELCLLISSEYLDPDFDWNITHWMHSDELFASVRLLVFARQGHRASRRRVSGGKPLPLLTVLVSTIWIFAQRRRCQARCCASGCPKTSLSGTWCCQSWGVIRRRRLYGCVTPSRGTHLQKLMRRLSFTAKRYLDIVLRRFRSL